MVPWGEQYEMCANPDRTTLHLTLLVVPSVDRDAAGGTGPDEWVSCREVTLGARSPT